MKHLHDSDNPAPAAVPASVRKQPLPLRRILLVGCPRSGTTLLQSMLGTHLDVFTFTESHFFPTYFHARNWMVHRVSEKLPERVREFLDENGLAGSFDLPAIQIGKMLRWSAVAQVKKCLALFDAMAEAHGKSAWLEKTPDNLHRLGILESASPGIRVIHIIREPNSVVPSLVKASQAWTSQFTPDTAREKWLRDVRKSLEYQGKDRHAFVLYEDLVQSPERVVRSLVWQLGLGVDRLKLENYQEVAARVIAPGEWWKENNTRPVKASEQQPVPELPRGREEPYETIYLKVKSICAYPEPPVPYGTGSTAADGLVG